MKKSTSQHSDHYYSTVAVFLQEILKLVSCLLVLCIQHRSLVTPVHKLWGMRRAMLSLLVPALCYTGQNNLLYVGVSFLPAAVAQVFVQTKLLWAAVFSITLLHKRFSIEAWASFVVLMLGVVLVKDGADSSAHGSKTAGGVAVGGFLFGALASVGAAGLSGFAGVYLEKVRARHL